MKRPFIIPVLLVLCATTFVSRSLAAPITFTFTGTASGTLTGGSQDVVITDAAFAITAVANTDNRQSFSGGYSLLNDAASIWIDGIGTLEFQVQTGTFFNDDNNVAGFSRSGPGDLFSSPADPILDGWDMLSSIGPIVGNVQLLQWSDVWAEDKDPVPTDGGGLVFEDALVSGSFLAVVGTSVPDTSSTMLLVGVALGLLVGFRRKIGVG